MPRLEAFTMNPYYECLDLLVSPKGKVFSKVATFEARYIAFLKKMRYE